MYTQSVIDSRIQAKEEKKNKTNNGNNNRNINFNWPCSWGNLNAAKLSRRVIKYRHLSMAYEIVAMRTKHAHTKSNEKKYET